MESKNLRKVFVITSCAAFASVIAGCAVAVAGVVYDLCHLHSIGMVLVLVGLAALAVCILAALFSRKWLSALAGTVVLAVCLAACLAAGILIGAGQHHPPRCGEADTSNAGETAFDTEIEIDSMGVSMTLRSDATAAEPLVQERLSGFVSRQLFCTEDGEAGIAAPSYGGNLTAFPSYGGNLTAFLHDCVRLKWEELRDATFSGSGEEDSEIPSADEMMEYTADDARLTSGLLELRKVYETDSLVSWASRCEVFVQASAHPSFRAGGITIRKGDGTAPGHHILKDTGSPSFRGLLKEGLRQWIARESEEDSVSDDMLREYLLGDDKNPDALPLPEQSPYLTEEGVALPYQENELIFCSEPVIIVLPYDKVCDFLNIEK